MPANMRNWREASQAYADEFIRAICIKPDAGIHNARAGSPAPPERPRAARHLVRKILKPVRTSALVFEHAFPCCACSEMGQSGGLRIAQPDDNPFVALRHRGATTIWETWDGIDEAGNPHGSLNHYSYGAVSGWLAQTVAGIEIGGRYQRCASSRSRA